MYKTADEQPNVNYKKKNNNNQERFKQHVVCFAYIKT